MPLWRYLALAMLIGVASLAGLAAARWVPTAPPPPPDYAKDGSWLCRPGRQDVCGTPVTATVVSRDGAKSVQTFAPDPNAPVDCFYVYPTVSRVRRAYAPIAATDDEAHAARMQLARFATVCRPFAPLYRQVTLAGLPALFSGRPGVKLDVPYADVLAAWKRYLAHDNGGRRVVLIGHSQGSRLLAKLIAAEIDGKPMQAKIVAAILPGATIEVPVGKDVGGTFKSMPLCHPSGGAGCVIAYSTFPANPPVPPDAHFGATAAAWMRDACVNPAELAGDRALDADIPLRPEEASKLGTTFVELPGAVTAACRNDGRFSILAIEIGDRKGLEETPDVLIKRVAQYHPASGFHGLDINLAEGTLVDLVRRFSVTAGDTRNGAVTHSPPAGARPL